MDTLLSSGEVQQAPNEKHRDPIPQISSAPLVITRVGDEDAVAQQTPVTVQSTEDNIDPILQNGKTALHSHEPSDESNTYVHGGKLAIITVSVALSVLLVALVSRI